MLSFKNIVLTTDLSENSKAAIPLAVEFARASDGKIFLLHVLEDISEYFARALANGIVIGESAWVNAIHKDERKRLDALAAELAQNEKVEVVPVCRTHKKPAVDIVNYAGEIHADCIVIATHGATGFSHMVNGSVAERVVRTSPCPVVTVRPSLIGKVALDQVQKEAAHV